MKDSKTVNLNLQRTILNGVKISHSVSQPVLRQEAGKWYLASFIFFYNREDIQTGMVNRPTVWALADLETGQLIREMQTKEQEFSEAASTVCEQMPNMIHRENTMMLHFLFWIR